MVDKSGTAQSDLFELKEETPKVEEQAEAPVVETKTEEVEVSAEDQAADDLKQQLEALKRSEAQYRERAAQEARFRAEAVKQAQERQVQLTQFQQDAAQSRLLAVNNAIAAAVAEAEGAKNSIAQAITNGDPAAQADAYERLATAKANLATLENGKSSLEEEVQRQAAWAQEQERQRQLALQRAQQQPQGDSLDQSGLPDRAKQWLRAHPEYIQDHRKNAKIQALHWDILDEGHQPFTDGYFQSMEQKLGMATNMSGTNREQRQQERPVAVSAPVSREVPNSSGTKPSNSQIRLTAQEREAAKMAGITETEYAKQKVKMEEARKAGQLQ